MDPIIFTSATDAEGALLADALAPPPPPSTLAAGPTAELRQAMARFSGTATHPERRTEVVGTITALDGYPWAAEASRRSAAILDTRSLDGISALGFVVPVDTMSSALRVAEDELSVVRSDVRSIAGVIGRGEPSGAASDAATRRLLRRFGQPGPDAVSSISMLYQTQDGTAALFAAAALAHYTGSPRRSALSRTTRVATEATTIGSTAVAVGTPVIVDLEASGLEFGAGPHACPGRAIAERIVGGMIQALQATTLDLSFEDIEWHRDDRAKTLPFNRVDPP